MDQHHHNQSAAARQQQHQNRYAHLVSSTTNNGNNINTTTINTNLTNTNPNYNTSNQNSDNSHYQHNVNMNKTSGPKAPTLGSGYHSNQYHGHQSQSQNPNQNHSHSHSQNQRPAYANYYYNSFSSVDWREQWLIMKEKILEKVEEPTNQRRLILVIVCCALLLDNMLYMVIVPIIPDYLRSIGAWSTYTENAKWIRRNLTGGHAKWERIGGNVIYEGEDSAVGFLFASKAIVQLFINPFSGHIIDRIGYEIPMMIGLTGVGSAFADTSGLAMIADRFTEENERQRALGVALAFISFGCLVAPPFGAVLYQGAGKEVPFIILSLVCLLDGSLLLLVTPPGTFAQCFPNYKPPPGAPATLLQQQQPTTSTMMLPAQQPKEANRQAISDPQENGGSASSGGQLEDRLEDRKKRAFQRQKSISRRQSMTVASAGEAPKGTPIYVLFRDPYIACCSGALIVANVSLAFLEPTISIWIQNTMPDIEEWQMGMIWLPAFFPHVFGVYLTVKLADKYPKFQWLIAAIGLILEGISCLMVPFCTSFWSLMLPISLICFGLALIDTAILPTLGYLVDTRYVSVYGSIYAIADISYSLSYAIGPIIAGGIVEAIGFTALNFLIAIVTLGYTPILMMLRTIHDYEPFEGDQSGLKKKKAKELAPFGKFGRQVISEEAEEEEEEGQGEQAALEENRKKVELQQRTSSDNNYQPFQSSTQQQQQQSINHEQYLPSRQQQQTAEPSRYESPSWAASNDAQQQQQPQQQQQQPRGSGEVVHTRKSVLVKKNSVKAPSSFSSSSTSSACSPAGQANYHSSNSDTNREDTTRRQQHSVKIIEGPPPNNNDNNQFTTNTANLNPDDETMQPSKNPFFPDELR